MAREYVNSFLVRFGGIFLLAGSGLLVVAIWRRPNRSAWIGKQ